MAVISEEHEIRILLTTIKNDIDSNQWMFVTRLTVEENLVKSKHIGLPMIQEILRKRHSDACKQEKLYDLYHIR